MFRLSRENSTKFNVLASLAGILFALAVFALLWIHEQPGSASQLMIATETILSVLAVSFAVLLGWDMKTVHDFKKVFGRNVPADEDERRFVQRNVNRRIAEKFTEIRKAEVALASFLKKEGDPKGFSTDEETDRNLESLAEQRTMIDELYQEFTYHKKVASRQRFAILADREYARMPA